MNLESFKKKFYFFEKFKTKMPGVLNLLKEFSDNKQSIKTDINYDVVTHYDYIYNNFDEYSFVNLNTKINYLYTTNIINNKLIMHNKLYWIFSSVYEDHYNNYKYKYNKNSCNMHDVLANFFHSLIKNITADTDKFFILPLLNGYRDIQFFDPEVTADKYYMFLFNLILKLHEAKVLYYFREEHAIIFNPEYKYDLNKLIFFSFDLMLLGQSSVTNRLMNSINLSKDDIENEINIIYNKYELANDFLKTSINDMLVSLVISSSVNIISVHSKINNIYIETIINK